MNKAVLKQLTVVVGVISLAGFTIQTVAASEMQRRSSEDLVVTATRTAERPIDVTVITEVITSEKIALSGVTHVGDVIGKYITGHYHKYSGLLSPVGLRGFRTESHGDDVKGYVLILVDGHRAGTGNAAKINVDRVERIEITKGPASALYGSAAIGGVINIITKKGEGAPTATIGADVGSFDYYKGKVSGGGEINDQFRVHLAASYEDVGDYDDPTYGTVYNTSETKKNIGGNLTYALSPNHNFRIGGNYGDLTGEYPSWEGRITYSSYSETTRSNYDKSNGYADAEYNGDYLDGLLHWRALGYYLWDRNQWNYGFPNPKDSLAKYTDTTWGTDQQITLNLTSWNTLVAGFNLEWLEKESEGVSGGTVSAPYTPGMEYDHQAVFLQNAVDLFDNRVNIIGAVRYDRFELTTTRPTGSFTSFDERTETYDEISPKLGVGIKFFDEFLRLRANVGEGFKSPSADQLSANYVTSTGTFYYGNPDLDPETSRTYDVGIDLFHEFFTLNLGYFNTDFEDKIVRTPTTVGGDPATTWINLGDAEIAGIDILLDWHIGRTFNWPVNLSLWTNATINTTKEDEETGDDLLYISDYEVKSGLILNYRNFSGQLSYVLVGPQMITNYDTYADEEKGSFDFWDLTVRYRFLENWEVHGSILNLLDDEVEWVRGYIMPERNFRVGLSYTF